MSETIEYVDRYGGPGASRPDPETMCRGQCEGMGCVPVGPDDPNDHEGPWHDLWLEAEAKEPAGDGWHMVKCHRCQGTGLEPA